MQLHDQIVNANNINDKKLIFKCVSFSMFWLKIFFRYWRHLVRAQKAMKEEMAEDRFVFDAFVSYTRNDQKWVIKELLQKVEYETNIKLCLHQRYRN